MPHPKRAVAMPLAPLDHIPPHLLTLADHEQQARQHLSDAAWTYLQGGAGEGRCARANVAAFEALPLMPRVLRNLRHGHLRTTVAGQPWPTPVMLAPIGHQTLFHPDGEQATALAARVTQTPVMISCLSSTPFAELTAAAHAPSWLQLYWQPSPDQTLHLLHLGEAAGVQALVLTVDAPVSGLRHRQQRVGFVMPKHAQPTHVRPTPAPQGHTSTDRIFAGWMAQAPTWDDVDWLRRQTALPLWLKGITHPDDARRAVDLGIDGLIVSTHGGRVLDDLPAAVSLLPAIRQAVPPDCPLILDSGIRQGSDVVKAIVQGADAVLLGRPYIHGLATAGALGVAHVLRLLEAELAITMALCGHATVEDIKAARAF